MARLARPRALTPVFAALWLLGASPARAEDVVRCPSVDGGAPLLGEIDGRRRLGFVREVMSVEARRARTWSLAWAVTGLGLAAGNFTLAALADTPDERIDPIVGGAASLFIPAAILVDPLQVMSAERAMEAEIAALAPAPSASGVCDTLARAEHRLAQSADNEAFKAGIATHVFVIVGNGAIALFLGLGFDHWKGALVNGGGGLLISEFQILTQPTGAVTELARYRRGEVPPSTSIAPSARIVPWIAANSVGLAAVGTF